MSEFSSLAQSVVMPEGIRMTEAKRIILVEDKPEFANAATKFLRPRGIELFWVNDFEKAEYLIYASETIPDNIKYDGAIVDCFFPEFIGGGIRDKGRVALEKLAESDPREQGIRNAVKAIGQYIGGVDPGMTELIRAWAGRLGSTRLANLENEPLYQVIKQVSETIGHIGTSKIAENTLRVLYDAGHDKDHYLALERAINSGDVANQPLGILVGDALARAEIPFVMTTSTNHHGILTQPITDYCARMGWTLLDDAHGNKTEPRFWEKAYDELNARMRKEK